MPKKKTGKVAVVGLGYVGLPLAVLAREKGWQTVGIDINPERVAQIRRRQSPLADERLARQLEAYPIEATLDFSQVKDADIVVVAVPTPVTLDKQPDLHPLISAIENLLPHLNRGQTLIVESTVNPGVMDEVVIPVLQRRPELAELKLAYCPERINPGDPRWNVRNIPRVLGAASGAAQASALDFYSSILEAPIKLMGSMTEAEAVKIFENSFRDINIAFVNEMARSFDCLGIDIMHVIEGASTKPFAFLAHYPGNGVGGHCISVDPYYMIERGHSVGFHHKFLQLARDINNSMPAFTVELLERGLKKLGLTKHDVTVAVLGIAYKKDTADDRESPAVEVRHLLEKQGYQVIVFDPFFPRSGVAEPGSSSSVSSLTEALKQADVVMLATNHSEFIQNLTAETLKKNEIKFVVDGKNALDMEAIVKGGIPYYGVGRGGGAGVSSAPAAASV